MPDESRRHFWQVPEPLVTGAWAEKRRLAAAVRELVALTVTTEAPEAVLAETTQAVRAAITLLREHPERTFRDGFSDCRSLDDFAVFTDRATLVGECNPYAPPMKLSAVGDEAVALVTFGPAFEGAPGFVHGGLVAAAFDQLFGYLQSCRQVPSLTRELTVRYKRPTPFSTELRIEGKWDRSEGRRHYLSARLLAEGEVTAEAEAVFVSLEKDGFRGLFDVAGRSREARKP
jgi:acyl-coenzyme A thioesterase PaaI-like protein